MSDEVETDPGVLRDGAESLLLKACRWLGCSVWLTRSFSLSTHAFPPASMLPVSAVPPQARLGGGSGATAQAWHQLQAGTAHHKLRDPGQGTSLLTASVSSSAEWALEWGLSPGAGRRLRKYHGRRAEPGLAQRGGQIGISCCCYDY